MKECIEKRLETDVLVIGAGGAGLRAAIEAQNEGVDVLVVSKGDFPSGCTTARAMGAMLAHFDKKDSAERHFEDTLRGGDYLNNPKLVRLLVEHAAQRARDIDKYGTEFDKLNDSYSLFPLTGSSIARGVIAGDRYRGGFFKGLVKEAKRLGIKILDHIMITDLIKDRGAVAGAVGLKLDSENILIISAKAVILATGGAGNLYSLTTNPPSITGDGYALAYRAGAMLSDMEFVQGRASMIYPDAMRGTPPPADGCVTIGGRFYNGLCERYMKKYHPKTMELVTRAEMSKCTQKEITEGRGSPHGGVFGDLSGVPQDELSKFKAFLESCAAENFDPSWQPYEWAPGAHYFMGGIVINEHCETDIKGLYAAGECESGIMGANRLAGNALTETQVFGAIAGSSAAKYSSANSQIPISSDKINPLKNRLGEILVRDRGFDYLEVREELTKIMSLYAGVIRNGEGLQKAITLLDKIEKEKIKHLCLVGERSHKTLGRLLEVENFLTISQIISTAALMRTETRGAHSREDYPELDEGWTKNIVIQLKDNRMKIGTKPVERI